MQDEVPPAFHALALRDPLFSAEGMDLENGRAALGEIERNLLGLEEAYAEHSIFRRLFLARYPLARYAIPVHFLRLFIASEKARRAYLVSPTRPRALDLFSAWQAAAAEYAASLRRYRILHDILSRLETNGRSFRMADQLGHVTSHALVLHEMEALRQNAASLEEAVEARRALLRGETVRPPAAPPRRELGELQDAAMTPWQREVHAAEIAGGVSPFRFVDIEETHGPFFYTLQNFDRTPTKHAFMFYLTKDRKSGLRAMWPALVDHFLFIDFWRDAEPDDTVTFAKYAGAVGLEREEIPYWYEAATYLYASRDPSYWMDIATRVDLIRRPGLDANLIHAQRSSMFDCLLTEWARDIRLAIANQKRRDRARPAVKSSMLYELLTRGAPSLGYLTFNTSVWRLSERPLFFGDSFEPSAWATLSQDEAREKLTPQALAAVMRAPRLREERGVAGGWIPPL